MKKSSKHLFDKKLIILIIAIFLAIFLSCFYIVNNNNNYKKNMLKEVNKKYPKEVVYVNKYGDKYIVKTKDEIVVLDDKYEEVDSISLDKINSLDYELVYRKNAIMYQKTEVKDNRVIYTYYDITTTEEIDKIEIEG